MKTVWIIAKKELASFFDSLIAYILLVVFLGMTGFFTWLYSSDVFFRGQANIDPFFSIAYWTLFFFIPALSMKMIAEEKKVGTLELLQTKSVTDWQIILGKFFACLMLVAIALVCSLPYYITVAQLGPIDHGAVWCGYLGILLMSAAYIGIGLLASSLTNNQIVAFLLSLLIGVFFLIIFGQLSGAFGGWIGKAFQYLNISTHYGSMTRGVIDSRDIIYFLSITGFCLFLAEMVLSRRRIAQ